jgi:hypothetical protein
MGPQPGSGQLNPNANGTEIPWVPPATFKPSNTEAGKASRRVILPGATFPPADAIPVDVSNDAVIANGASATLISVKVPDQFTFRIAGIGFGAGDESGLIFLSWSLFADPPVGTITPYVNMPASIGSIQQLSDVFVVQGASVTVTLVATNNAPIAVSYDFAARMRGWFYSEKEVP